MLPQLLPRKTFSPAAAEVALRPVSRFDAEVAAYFAAIGIASDILPERRALGETVLADLGLGENQNSDLPIGMSETCSFSRTVSGCGVTRGTGPWLIPAEKRANSEARFPLS
jgi:hypothetical protein